MVLINVTQWASKLRFTITEFSSSKAKYYIYSLTDNKGNVIKENVKSTRKIITIKELQPNTTYTFDVKSYDSNDVELDSKSETATTLDSAKMYKKESGNYKRGRVLYKASGTWKVVAKIYIKKEGTWLESI